MAGYLLIVLFVLGIWGMINKSNLIKKVIALNMLNSTIVILFIYLGSLTGSTAPILVKGIADIVDPLPQALMLTAIVIGICLTALALSLVLKMYRDHGTLDIRRIENRSRRSDE